MQLTICKTKFDNGVVKDVPPLPYVLFTKESVTYREHENEE